MKVFQQIKDFFTLKAKPDLPALVVCFALSCFIYYVYRSQTLKSNTVSVELQIVNKNENAFVQSSPPSTQHIQISIEGENAESLKPDDFRAYIDLSYVPSSGTHDFPVLIDYVSDRVKNDISLQTKCKPSHVLMEVDEVITDFVKVKANIIGKPMKGFIVKDIQVDPPYILVTGPKSKIKGRNFINTEPVSIINARTSLKSEGLKLEDNLLFSEIADNEFSVEVEIAPIKEKRTFDLVPITLVNVDPKLEISSYRNNISLDIYGNQADLDLFEIPKDFIIADCSGIHTEGKHNVPITINLSQKFAVAENLIKNIPVTFNRKVVQVENIVEDVPETEVLIVE